MAPPKVAFQGYVVVSRALVHITTVPLCSLFLSLPESTHRGTGKQKKIIKKVSTKAEEMRGAQRTSEERRWTIRRKRGTT